MPEVTGGIRITVSSYCLLDLLMYGYEAINSCHSSFSTTGEKKSKQLRTTLLFVWKNIYLEYFWIEEIPYFR